MRPEQLFARRMLQMAAPRPGPRVLHASAKPALPPAERRPLSHRADRGPVHEFVFAVRGTARIVTPTESFTLRPGRLLLIDPGVAHEELPADPPCPYLVFWCEVHRTHCLMSHTAYAPDSGWSAGPTLEAHGRTHLQNLAAAIGSELHSRQWGWERAVFGLLGYLSALVIRRLRAGSASRLPCEPPNLRHEPRCAETIEAVGQYCRAHLREPLRLETIAAAVGYSASHISHLFTSQLGRTVSDYVRELRLSTGDELLLNTDLPISEISELVGYRDPAHFTRAFNQVYRTSPRTYRRRYRPL